MVQAVEAAEFADHMRELVGPDRVIVDPGEQKRFLKDFWSAAC